MKAEEEEVEESIEEEGVDLEVKQKEVGWNDLDGWKDGRDGWDTQCLAFGGNGSQTQIRYILQKNKKIW